MRRWRTTRALAFGLISLVLVQVGAIACGGDDDDESGGAATSDGTTAAASTAQPNGNTQESEDSVEVPEGAPQPEDPDFPDVYASLEAGSSAEAATGEDLELKPGRVRITIIEILDPAEPEPIYQAPSGTRLWAVRILMESLDEGSIPVAEFYLHTSDGNDVQSVPGATADSLVLFGEISKGESTDGVVVFEVPQDASVEYLYIDPSIYVGRNIVFLE